MKERNEILVEYGQKCDQLRIKFLDNTISYDEYEKEMDKLFEEYMEMLKK